MTGFHCSTGVNVYNESKSFSEISAELHKLNLDNIRITIDYLTVLTHIGVELFVAFYNHQSLYNDVY